jgi:peptidoglycan/xylan/chitin deacetylase (PgdA/CDA1 family)
MQTPLSILIYHRVLAQPDPLFPGQVDARRFASQVRALGRGFNILPLGAAVRRLRAGTLPARAACITFDDGYADNVEVALPILQHYRAAATFFVATGFLHGGTMWNDAVIDLVRHARGDCLNLARIGLGRFDIRTPSLRRAAIETLLAELKYLPPAQRLACVKPMLRASAPLMMNPDQVLALHRAGMEIGAHTVSHPILTTLDAAAARHEIAQGRKELEQIIDVPVRLFAYPNGKPGIDFEPHHVDMVRALGFDAAVTTAWGSATTRSDPFKLPRFTPWDSSSARFLLRLAGNWFRRA